MLVRQNLKAFSSRVDIIVTACATCSMTIKKVWPSVMSDESSTVKEAVHTLSGKLMDIVQFLAMGFARDVEKSRNVYQSSKTKVTYHDPCHLRKSLGIWKEPREILASLQEYEFVEMSEADSCCGFGGSFALKHGDISERIGDRKIGNIIQTGAEIVSTACPGCMLQIASGVSKAKASVQVKHIVELVANSQNYRWT
ncbi:MAG: heterodisulfide reductase-related iron-sulfur binding cluster [Thermodesulforhabdaceae bacterium]